ncbi:MAG TPA: S8 family serine peptidase [Acidimicrobiales bacterium]|jgi:subtilisin family serine protease
MTRARLLLGLAALSLVAGLLPAVRVEAAAAPRERWIVTATSAAELAGLRDRAQSRGAEVVLDISKLNAFVVEATSSQAASLRSDRAAADVSLDEIVSLSWADASRPAVRAPGVQNARTIAEPAMTRDASGEAGDPAMSYAGLLWDYRRIGAPDAWHRGATGEGITVAVMDTGVDYTHSELKDQVVQVIDLADDDNLCRRFFGTSDEMLAEEFGGPVDTDWHGHGTWIAGNIAAEMDGVGTNGIAFDVDLVAVKIAQWCGFASSSTLIEGFIEAADAGVDVLNISFGGYGDNPRVHQMYVDAVNYARERGMVIVASAGNDHTRIGTGGKVISHGTLTTPRAELFDPYGMWESPGGVRGVVDVSATNNQTVPSSHGCPEGTAGSPEDTAATCKPLRDRHQAAGQGEEDQLAYYSNYGPRIDIAGPGGARKFNLPVWDRGGTPGFPYTDDDLTNVWETFSTTSNWATQIPCFTFTRGSHFYVNECYSTIQGTSMAAPHVTASLAVIASETAGARGNVGRLVQLVQGRAIDAGPNFTEVLDPDDMSAADLTGVHCPTGYCHLGGEAVPDSEAYGAGLVYIGDPDDVTP